MELAMEAVIFQIFCLSNSDFILPSTSDMKLSKVALKVATISLDYFVLTRAMAATLDLGVVARFGKAVMF
jgi:hypothetical protein